MKTETIRTALTEHVSEMTDFALVCLHNNYCDAVNDPDRRVYFMDDFNEVMHGVTPWEIARSIFYGGHFCPVDEYFRFNGYGNLVSFNYVDVDDLCPVCVDDIVGYIIENDDDLENEGIRAILDGQEG